MAAALEQVEKQTQVLGQTLPRSKHDGWLLRQRDWALLAMVASGSMPRTEKEVIDQLVCAGGVTKVFLDILYDAATVFLGTNRGMLSNPWPEESEEDENEEPHDSLPLSLRGSTVLKVEETNSEGITKVEFKEADEGETELFYYCIDEPAPSVGKKGMFKDDQEREQFRQMLRTRTTE